MPRTRRSRGFTLIELLVVIAIIGILATIIVGSVKKAKELARIAQASKMLKDLDAALTAYVGDEGRPPLDTYVNWADDTANTGRLADTAAAESFLWYLLFRGKSAPYLNVNLESLSDSYDVANTGIDLLDPWNNPYLYVMALQQRGGAVRSAFQEFPKHPGHWNAWSTGRDGLCDSCDVTTTGSWLLGTHTDGTSPAGSLHVGGDEAPNDDIQN